MNTILVEILKERARQDQKWGVQSHSDERWYLILAEEVGEVAKSIVENDTENLEYELIQVMAVVYAWLQISKPEVLEKWRISQK